MEARRIACRRETGLLLFACCATPLLAGAWNEIQSYDPTQYASIGWHIFRTHDFLHLHDNDGLYCDKPPFTFWLMFLSFRIFGLTSLAVRMPSLLCVPLLCFITYRLGALLESRERGTWGAALLGSSLAVQLMVLDPKIDLVLTTLFAATVLFALEAKRRPLFVIAAWLTATLGVLTKGPIGLLGPAVAILPEARPFSKTLRLYQPWFGLPLMGLALYPFYRAVADEHGAAGISYLLWGQSFGRILTTTGWVNQTGHLFFIHTALWAFLPFWPLLIVELWRRARAFRFPLPPSEERVLLWWLVIPFLAISLSHYKLPQYLFWLAPPAALLAARPLTSLLPSRFVSLLSALVAAAALAVPILVLRFCFPPRSLSQAIVWLALPVIATCAALLAARRATPLERSALLLICSVSAANLFAAGYVHREILRYQPDARWGRLALDNDAAGTVLPFIDLEATQGAAFYADRASRRMSPAELATAFRAGQARVAVIRKGSLPDLTAAGLTATVLAELPVFHTSTATKEFLLASTRPSVLSWQQFVALTQPAQH